eukprot:7409801-Lingulodinium_polyedra.AAC.1
MGTCICTDVCHSRGPQTHGCKSNSLRQPITVRLVGEAVQTRRKLEAQIAHLVLSVFGADNALQTLCESGGRLQPWL